METINRFSHILSFPLLLLSILFSSCEGFELTYSIIDRRFETKAECWLDSLCSNTFAGRKSGTVGNHLCAEYLCNELTCMGYNPDMQLFNTSKGVQMRNIIVHIGSSNGSRIVIGAHYDGYAESNSQYEYPAANDNASGVVTLLSLLYYLQENSVDIHTPVTCCFWDGEEGVVEPGTTFAGSSYYLRQVENYDSIKYYLNLDSIGHPHDLFVKYSKSEDVDNAINSFINNGAFCYHLIDMDGKTGTSDYVPFHKAGIPFISFGDHDDSMCENNSHSPNDAIDAVSVQRLLGHVSNVYNMIKL